MVEKNCSYNNGVEEILSGFKPSSASFLIPLLRRVCLKCGIQLAARKLDFQSLDRHYEQKGPNDEKTSPNGPIYPADIVNIVPVVKHCQPLIPYLDAHHL